MGLALALCIATAGCVASHPPATPRPGLARISGRVVGIEHGAARVELADAGRRFYVFYSPDTLVKSGTEELSPDDLREGDRVVVSLEGAPGARARLITLAGPPRKRAPAAPSPGEEPIP